MNKWILLVLLCTNLLSCSSLTTEGDLAEVKEFPRFHKRPVLVRIYRQFDGLLDDRKAHSYYMPDKNLEIRVKKALHKMNLFSSVELIQIPEQKTETSFEFKVVENRIRPTRFEFKKYGEILDIVAYSNHKLVNKPTNPIGDYLSMPWHALSLVTLGLIPLTKKRQEHFKVKVWNRFEKEPWEKYLHDKSTQWTSTVFTFHSRAKGPSPDPKETDWFEENIVRNLVKKAITSGSLRSYNPDYRAKL